MEDPVITDISVFIAVVGQVTARVWLWPLAHHLHYHGHTHHSMATQVSAWRLRKVGWKSGQWHFFPTSHFVWLSILHCYFTWLTEAYQVHGHAFHGRMCSVCFWLLVVSYLDLPTFLLVLYIFWGQVCILGPWPLLGYTESMLWLQSSGAVWKELY